MNLICAKSFNLHQARPKQIMKKRNYQKNKVPTRK
uniref:Uncharacterized protein n=1 Tax=Rhizophora mucronata TaxID=61149 RepID=A0A2P2N2G4_RHIMU